VGKRKKNIQERKSGQEHKRLRTITYSREGISNTREACSERTSLLSEKIQERICDLRASISEKQEDELYKEPSSQVNQQVGSHELTQH